MNINKFVVHDEKQEQKTLAFHITFFVSSYIAESWMKKFASHMIKNPSKNLQISHKKKKRSSYMNINKFVVHDQKPKEEPSNFSKKKKRSSYMTKKIRRNFPLVSVIHGKKPVNKKPSSNIAKKSLCRRIGTNLKVNGVPSEMMIKICEMERSGVFHE